MHRHLQASPDARLKAMAPSREDLGSAVDCLCTGSWLADLCAQEGLPWVLGPALSMTAIHGGKAKHDTSAAHTMAGRLRGGMLPHASGAPAEMRAPRALLRRRLSRTRQRAERLPHGQHPNSPYHRPASGTTLASKANRDGVAERCPEPAVPQSLAVDRARRGAADERRRALA